MRKSSAQRAADQGSPPAAERSTFDEEYLESEEEAESKEEADAEDEDEPSGYNYGCTPIEMQALSKASYCAVPAAAASSSRSSAPSLWTASSSAGDEMRRLLQRSAELEAVVPEGISHSLL